MSTATTMTDVLTDLQKICSPDKPDPALLRRIQERSEQVQEEMRRLGKLDIAVPLLREVRAEG